MDTTVAPLAIPILNHIRVRNNQSLNNEIGATKLFAKTISCIQKQFFIADKLYPDSTAYNIISCVEIDGNLNVERLKRAWTSVFESVDIFRTFFKTVNGNYYALTDESIKAPWEEHTCNQLDFNKCIDEICYTKIQIDTPPLVRTALIKLDNGKYRFVLVQHHIITDLYSKNIISKLISDSYNDIEGANCLHPYSDYEQIEKDFLESEKGRKAIYYWQDKIRTFPKTLKLPQQYGKNTEFRGNGKSIHWNCPNEISSSIIKNENTKKTQPFLWFLTAYFLFLSKITGRKRLAIGVPLTNRRSLNSNTTVGPYVNILPVVISVEKTDSFNDMYTMVRNEMLLNHRYQDVPFYEIAKLYNEPRDQFRPHLLQAGFTSEPLFKLWLEDVDCHSIAMEKKGAQLDLFFNFWPVNNGYAGHWEYNNEMVSGDIVKAWIDVYEEILIQSLNDPDMAISGFRLMSDDAMAEFNKRNDICREYPLDQNVAAYLRQTFERYKNESALICDGKRYSYQEMGQIVQNLSASIYNRFGQKKRIALLMKPSAGMVFAIHGVLQSGNAYVPIGVEWPKSRIQKVLNDVEPAAVICDQNLSYLIEEQVAQVIFAESIDTDIKKVEPFPELHINSDDSAYIIYTSGSTGMPKGVEIPHKGLLNRLLWMQEEYQLTQEDQVVQKTPYTFDVSVWEFIWPFMAGAGLSVIKPGGHMDPHYLKDILMEHNVSVLHFVPSMLSIFLKVPGIGDITSIRDVICSGEALSKTDENIFFDLFKNTRLHNLYGPTEASIDVTFWECGKENEVEYSTVPIGHPISNTQLYIVDEFGYLCPPLVTGELLIGGIGLAKGYWKRKDLTDEKFIPNTFGQGKLYRTGDLARYRVDGTIEYIGRKDFQIKLRGMRVELGEIERALEKHDEIDVAAVTLWQKKSGDERLVAYFTSTKKEDLHLADSLKAYLDLLLPPYMVPGHYVQVDKMPINANGKLDRKGLPLPDICQTNHQQSRPENNIQESIRNLWITVLEEDHIGIDDNFFDVGGHSIKLMDLNIKIQQAFDIKIDIVDLFRFPSIRGMATLVQNKNTENKKAINSRGEAQRKRLKALRSIKIKRT